MLVLSRHENQRVIIGNSGEIVVTVMEISGGRVKLSFKAPDDTPIYREEIWVAMQNDEKKLD